MYKKIFRKTSFDVDFVKGGIIEVSCPIKDCNAVLKQLLFFSK